MNQRKRTAVVAIGSIILVCGGWGLYSLLRSSETFENPVLEGHTGKIHSVSFSPDGRTLASGSTDETIKLWDVATGRCVATLRGHTAPVLRVRFNPGGDTLASCQGTQVKLWAVETGKEIATIKTDKTDMSWAIAFSPDGESLASAGGRAIHLWDVRTRKERIAFTGHRGAVHSISFSPGGRTLASGGDKTAKIWDVKTGANTASLSHTMDVTCVAFSPSGTVLATADDQIKLWDVKTGARIAAFDKPPHLAYHLIRDLAFNPSGRWLASAGPGHATRLWFVEKGYNDRTEESMGTGAVNCVAFSPRGKILASAGEEGVIKLWNTETYR